jgi:hypothetical protein
MGDIKEFPAASNQGDGSNDLANAENFSGRGDAVGNPITGKDKIKEAIEERLRKVNRERVMEDGCGSNDAGLRVVANDDDGSGTAGDGNPPREEPKSVTTPAKEWGPHPKFPWLATSDNGPACVCAICKNGIKRVVNISDSTWTFNQTLFLLEHIGCGVGMQMELAPKLYVPGNVPTPPLRRQ